MLTSLAFAVGQCWIVAQNFLRKRQGQPLVQQIARLDEIPVGGVRLFQYPDPHKSCVLVRLGETDFVAYDQQCTHLACPVIPEPQANRLYCPCHEGVFDLATGRPVAGPPRRPLPRIRLEIRDGTVYAVGYGEETT
ncbi:MAG: Rieske 2Fe-2S domain-containing protein [Candidatus Latescibacteria bacterium]|nr:Rieske 2Fe-2S domain-containing protein [Candidatus Latescibacterota bacterium]